MATCAKKDRRQKPFYREILIRVKPAERRRPAGLRKMWAVSCLNKLKMLKDLIRLLKKQGRLTLFFS